MDEPLIPILCSIAAVLTSFGLPSAPVSSTRTFGTMKSVSPFVPAGAPSTRARTRWMTFSVRSWSPAEMKNLGAGDGVGAVGVLLGGRARRPHVAPCLRLGEAHRARPLAAEQPLAVERLLLRRPEGLDDLCRAVAQPRVHAEGRVRAAEELLDEGADRVGGLGAAVLRADGDRLPSRLVELLPGLLEAVRGLHAPVGQRTALRVPERVERPGHLAHEAVALGEGGRHLLGAPACERLLAEQLAELELLEEEEAELAENRPCSG